MPLHLSLFLLSVWALLLITLAAFDDIRRHLSATEAILYCLGLIAVCAINYVIFSVSTLYYVGYPLLVAYTAFALWRYFSKSRQAYLCGHCGHRLPSKGICPRCGYRNV